MSNDEFRVSVICDECKTPNCSNCQATNIKAKKRSDSFLEMIYDAYDDEDGDVCSAFAEWWENEISGVPDEDEEYDLL